MGILVGPNDGITVGTLNRCCVGIREGTYVGSVVGILEGTNVGIV